MELDFVKMKNFRQYVDQKITFVHPERDRNFTVILGANGAGKTNLLNAITWCLFSEELHMGTKYRGLPIVNTTTFKELNHQETCDVEVQIQFKEKSGQKILISRTLRILKTDKGNPQRIGSELVMMRQKGKDWINVTDPQYIIKKLIPKNLEEYFFFDGERLDRYFREETGETIRNAVFRISQLGLLERAIRHLKGIRNDVLRSSRGLSSKAEEIREFLDIQRRSLEVDTEGLNKLEADKAEAERRESGFSAKLRKISAEKISTLENQRIELDKDVERLDDEISRLEKEKFDFIFDF
jgi:DNA sulfur modification protein DndD